MVEKIRCSVGITAYNEEANIGRLLEAVVEQRLYEVEISDIIVVASGCTDRTEEIVRDWMEKEPRIQLHVQPRREGKTSAINLFLKHASEKICVLESGDTLPREDTIENMVAMFHDPGVGMTGAQKVAVNTPDHIVGLLSHLRLRMEHQLCLEIPRLGELIAFRKVFDQLPADVAMDEAFVEAFIIRRGMQVRYAPDAVVYSMGPETVGDFVTQRRRNYAGHLHLKNKYGYKVSSLENRRVVRIALEEVWGVVRLLTTLAVLATLEAYSRILGAWDYYVKKEKHVVWDMAWTTKDPGKGVDHGTPQGGTSP
ncbi:MAG: glycosyltransferase [Anaerolineae bacterium]|jgi:cellulose synthase/poly-beta-1,6-N-acetylglucosamine synthase-like glycosyltransferase